MNYFKQLKQKNKEPPAEEENKDQKEEEEDEENKEDKKDEKKEDPGQKEPVKQGKNIPPLITSVRRKRPQMTRERWMEMAQIRRWKVRITNISIENLFKETYDPFIEFVVGGDFKIIEKKVKKGKVEHAAVGTMGYSKKTEVLKYLESGEIRLFDTRIYCEYQGSYFDVQEQFLRIDIWDLEKWNLNEFLGRIEVPLMEIIQGDVNQVFSVLKSGEKKKIKLCRLSFTISFQEIWDFSLGFTDWGGCDLKGVKKNGPAASLELSLVSQGLFKTKIKSNVVEGEENPQWPDLQGNIAFRGTVNDLENEKLEIKIFDGGLLNKKLVAVKVSDMAGVIDSGIISADLKQLNIKAYEHQCSVKGRISIVKVPKNRQTGEIIILNSNDQYLCVSVMRVDNIVMPQDRGIVNTFIEVGWGGYLKRTKTAFSSYKPIYNDTFYFPINISKSFNKDKNSRRKAIMAELRLYSHIVFNLWNIDEQLSNDGLGSCNFMLNELASASVQEKEYFDEKSHSTHNVKVRVWSGKKQLTSPFIDSGEVSNLFIDVWVLFDNEKSLEYDDLPKEITDTLPENFQELEREWEDQAKLISESFPEENQRNFAHMALDEHNKNRFLPMFINKLGYPNPTKSMRIIGEDLPVEYYRVETIKECLYYCSLLPFSGQENDIWCSPEYLMQMKKGEIEDHAILLACLCMSATYDSRDDEDFEEFTENSDRTKADSSQNKKFEESHTEDDVLIENRVFVCVGSLKQRKKAHIWVVVLSKDCKDATFLEVSNNTSYFLSNRVCNPVLLKQFLNKISVKGSALNLVREQDKDHFNESQEDSNPDIGFDDELSEGSLDENDEIEKNIDRFKKEADTRLRSGDLDDNFRFKYKQTSGQNKDEGIKKTGVNFLEARRAEEQKDPKNLASIVQEPRLLPGAQEVDVPYRTIDIIFNNKNVYMNLQHFDPSRIVFDLYDPNLWTSFSPNNFNNFSAFYSPPILTPPLQLPSAKRLHALIMKEMKIGISAFRSGKNLGTSWKNQLDPVIALMEEHLVFLEKVARGEIDEDRAKSEKRQWGLKMRQFIPTLYRVSAIPAHFNYPEPNRIGQLFIEQSSEFFSNQSKTVKWAVAVRIFPYVSKIISIRILVAAFYPVPGGQ